MTRRKKTWLTALLAGVAAATAALAPATGPLVEVILAEVGRLLIGSEQEPAVALPGAADPREAAKSGS